MRRGVALLLLFVTVALAGAAAASWPTGIYVGKLRSPGYGTRGQTPIRLQVSRRSFACSARSCPSVSQCEEPPVKIGPLKAVKIGVRPDTGGAQFWLDQTVRLTRHGRGRHHAREAAARNPRRHAQPAGWRHLRTRRSSPPGRVLPSRSLSMCAPLLSRRRSRSRSPCRCPRRQRPAPRDERFVRARCTTTAASAGRPGLETAADGGADRPTPVRPDERDGLGLLRARLDGSPAFGPRDPAHERRRTLLGRLFVPGRPASRSGAGSRARLPAHATSLVPRALRLGALLTSGSPSS